MGPAGFPAGPPAAHPAPGAPRAPAEAPGAAGPAADPPAATAAGTKAAHSAEGGRPLGVHHLLQARLDGLPLFIAGVETLLEAIHHLPAHGGKVRRSAEPPRTTGS